MELKFENKFNVRKVKQLFKTKSNMLGICGQKSLYMILQTKKII